MNKLIIITGPTASGKTSTSISLAKFIQDNFHKKVAIVNFDSLLFYKELSIGTAKPTNQEMNGIEHHLISIESINNPINASDFIILAKEKIEELHQLNYIVILVGGSAFYLRALLKGMYEASKPDEELKLNIETEYKKFGIAPFIDFLRENDPESLQNLHSNDHYRLIRAVEFFKLTNSKISEQKKLLDQNSPYDFSKITHPWSIAHIYLDLPKNEHQKYIEKRSQEMLHMGLQIEVENLLKNGYSKSLKPLESIGYKEMINFLDGNYPTIQDCFERIVISTRQLAKSQRTFFKKISPKTEFNPVLDQLKIQKHITEFLTVD
jgi:tRNA dimethylallyltransferase